MEQDRNPRLNDTFGGKCNVLVKLIFSFLQVSFKAG